MALKEFTCDVQVMGKGTARGVVVWLTSNSQAAAKKAAQEQFPNDKLGSVYNVKEKK